MMHLDEMALEAAVLAHDKEEAAMRGEPDPWADERPDGEFAERKAAMALAIRAYLTALPSSPVSGLVERLDTCAVATFPIVQEAATTLTALAAKVAEMEAENARLKAEVERLRELASELPIVKYALRATEARLAEALKALEPFALVAKHDIGESDTDDDLFRPMERHNRAPRLTVGHLRAALTAAGFRIVGPEEVDPVTVEKCAEVANAEVAKHQGPFTSQPAYVASCAIRDALRALKEKQG